MCPEAVSLTWELGYIDAGSSFISRSISADAPPNSTFTLVVPLALSFTEGELIEPCLG